MSIFRSTIFADSAVGSGAKLDLSGAALICGHSVAGAVAPMFSAGVVFPPSESAIGSIIQRAITASNPPPETHAMIGLAFI